MNSPDLLDTLMEVYADAVNNGDGYLGRAQLEYTLMKHDLCLVDARDIPAPAQAPLRSAAERYMTAVKRLAEESGYNRLTYFEAPILDMPTEETKAEAHARWMELNNAGVELTKALAVPSTHHSPSAEHQLAEAGKAAIAIRNELDRTRAERDSWEAQFHSAAAAASEYSEFWEKHQRDFDQFGNYIPHSQIDGDLRAAKQRIAELEATTVTSTHQRATFCGLCDLEQQLHEDAQGFHHVIKGERVACPVSPAVLDTPTGGAE